MEGIKNIGIGVGDIRADLCHVDGTMMAFEGGTPTLYVIAPQFEIGGGEQEWKRLLYDELKLGLFTYSGVMLLAAKMGKREWVDAPYSPHLSQREDIPMRHCYDSGEAMPMNIIFVRSNDGMVMSVRPVALPTAFSNEMVSSIYDLLEKPFDLMNYRESIHRIQFLYSPSQIGQKKAQVRASFAAKVL